MQFEWRQLAIERFKSKSNGTKWQEENKREKRGCGCRSGIEWINRTPFGIVLLKGNRNGKCAIEWVAHVKGKRMFPFIRMKGKQRAGRRVSPAPFALQLRRGRNSLRYGSETEATPSSSQWTPVKLDEMPSISPICQTCQLPHFFYPRVWLHNYIHVNNAIVIVAY